MQFITEPGRPESANRLATCWRVENSIPTKDQDIPDQPIPLSTDIIGHTKYQRDALNIIYSSNILLYMFRVSSTHLQEDRVVCEQHMAPSLSVES